MITRLKRKGIFTRGQMMTLQMLDWRRFTSGEKSCCAENAKEESSLFDKLPFSILLKWQATCFWSMKERDNQRCYIWPEPGYLISDCCLGGKDGELLNNRWQTCQSPISFCCSCCLEISWLGQWQQPVEFQAVECICHYITFAFFESSLPHSPLPVAHPHCCSLLGATWEDLCCIFALCLLLKWVTVANSDK